MKKIAICVQLYRKDRKTGLRRLVFNTDQQDVVETAMTRFGYGSSDYWLCPVPYLDARRKR